MIQCRCNTPYVDQLGLAMGAMAKAANETKSEEGDPPRQDVILALITEEDLKLTVGNQLVINNAQEKLVRREQQLIDILTVILRKNGGRMRITQGEMDEVKGWKFDAGAADGALVLSVRPPQGRLVSM